MFNRRKIAELERTQELLYAVVKSLKEQVRLLAQHAGVAFKVIPEIPQSTIVVPIEKFDKFKNP